MRARTRGRRIGDVATAAGVSVDTLRFYEREGLLPETLRTAGGFRLYPPESAARVQFIRQAQQMGLSLREIRHLLDPEDGRCSAVRGIIAELTADVDRRLQELTAFRDMLHQLLERCDATTGRARNAACPSLRELGTTRP